MHYETRKIFRDDSIQVYPTAVRVPVYYGHSESLFIRTKKTITLEEIKTLLMNTQNVKFVGDSLVTPRNIRRHDLTYVSRLRKRGEKAFLMWVVADNVRVGAATNAVRILEKSLTKV